ncbi:Rrf2 family transcriptional regulator [Terrilactibacillus laevilacticus]|uniref:Rrf2 family transcriptional regulator n=1 Tax=Terrilactibacillus laevilacticus TaxID=1380157 RepID=UPI001146F8C4|nr:Rrf2 family transcriptional regulator [Terrilactibacillus laevilacticus]
MINSRLAVAIHILTLIASRKGQVEMTSEFIAGSVNTNPVVIRRIIGMLRKADILKTQAGVAGAVLARNPDQITLLDVYRAVEPRDELFSIHEDPNPNCPVGKRIQGSLDHIFHHAQSMMESELSKTTIKDILTSMFA